MEAPLQTHFPSPLVPQVHEGAIGCLEHTNNLRNLVTCTLIWSPRGHHNIKRSIDRKDIKLHRAVMERLIADLDL